VTDVHLHEGYGNPPGDATATRATTGTALTMPLAEA
jgi:hypothetical protein